MTDQRFPALQGKTVMVTGSSSGIGKAIAIHCARLGANLILHGRAPSPHLEQVAEQLQSMSASFSIVTADFLDRAVMEPTVDQAWSAFGSIDHWVNNAGGDVLTTAMREQDLATKADYLWRVDVLATLLLSRLVAARMRRQSDAAGSAGQFGIINLGWDQANQGMAGESGELFAATKGAIMAMTRSLAQSYAPQVRVNCVAPGWIKTAWGGTASDEWDRRARQDALMQRWGTPEDVAGVVAFLCSPSAEFISGQIVPVNGGFRFGPAGDER